MIAALTAFGWWLAKGLHAEMRREALLLNQTAVDEMLETIQRLQPADLRLGSPHWERIQKTIERERLPNDGFLSIVELDEGRIVCHPDVRKNPTLFNLRLGKKGLRQEGGGVMTLTDAAAAGSSSTGWIELPEGRHLIAVRAIPELNACIIAHQSERSIMQVIAGLNTNAWQAGIAFALLATIGTASLTMMVVRRYEHRLADLNHGLELQVERRGRALVRTRDAVIFGLAHLAESRHECTGEHLARIGSYVECLAKAMARHDPTIDERFIHTLVVASSLHDIGKVGVPDSVLLKPGKLTPRERAVMQQHTTIGGGCLQAIKHRLGNDNFLNVACEIALAHHERWNGQGYPNRLKAEDIPLSARIVAVADVYDALTSERAYKRGMTHAQARNLIARGSGEQFDPAIVEAFLSVECEFARIAETSLSPATASHAA